MKYLLTYVLLFLTIGAVNKEKKAKQKYAGNHFYNSLRLFCVFYPIFFSPRVKQSAIITYKLRI